MRERSFCLQTSLLDGVGGAAIKVLAITLSYTSMDETNILMYLAITYGTIREDSVQYCKI